MFEKTDDLQYVARTGEDSFYIIEAREAGDKHIVCNGLVNIKNWLDSDGEYDADAVGIIKSYYESVDNFHANYTNPDTRKQILAEMFFESTPYSEWDYRLVGESDVEQALETLINEKTQTLNVRVCANAGNGLTMDYIKKMADKGSHYYKHLYEICKRVYETSTFRECSLSTEVTREHLSEWFCPTVNWKNALDGIVVDYAEVEIDPTGIKKLEDNLDRCGSQDKFTDAEWQELIDESSDAFEHVVCYVHFYAGTDNFKKLFINVISTHDDCPLVMEQLLNAEEQNTIIAYARELLQKSRGTDRVINEKMNEERKE